MRLKQGVVRPGDEPVNESEMNVEIIDVSDYHPKRIPSKIWRECIEKVWEVDPLLCPYCNSKMKIICFITGEDIIYKILDHLGMWAEKPSRDPPSNQYFTGESIVREPFKPVLNLIQQQLALWNRVPSGDSTGPANL
ncbi:MAG: hypothetical protein GY774_04525 [Planctomycetes bacterium]|nr:hypothetical protein [Planctomycetota bacterium]